MLNKLLPFIKKKSKINGKLDEDLLQVLLEVTFGKALKTFDLNKNIKFITYLNYILHHKKIKFLKKYHNDYNGVNIDSFDSTISAKDKLNKVNINNKDLGLELKLSKLILGDNPVENNVVNNDLKEKVMDLFNNSIYGRDKRILNKYIFKNKTFKEIAEDEGVSTQRIGQLYHRALKDLKRTCKFYGITG